MRVGAPAAASMVSTLRSGSDNRSALESASTIQPRVPTQKEGITLRGAGSHGELYGFQAAGKAALPSAGRQRGPAAWVTYGIDDRVSGPPRISKDPVGVISRGRIRASGSEKFARVQRNRVVFAVVVLVMAGLVLYQFLAS